MYNIERRQRVSVVSTPSGSGLSNGYVIISQRTSDTDILHIEQYGVTLNG